MINIIFNQFQYFITLIKRIIDLLFILLINIKSKALIFMYKFFEQRKKFIKDYVKQTVGKIKPLPQNTNPGHQHLSNKASLNRYQKPRYWAITKIKRQDKQVLVSFSNIQHQEKIFKVQNKSIDEQQATMAIIKRGLQRHDSVLIQTFKEFKDLTRTIEKIKTQIKNLEETEKTEKKKNQSLEKELQILTQMYLLQILGVKWHYSAVSYPKEESCRIIILMLNKKRYDQNYFIYKKQLTQMPAAIQEFKQFISNSKEAQDIQDMLQMIKIHIFKDKHKGYFENIRKQFQQKLNKSLINYYLAKKKQRSDAKKKFYDELNEKKIFPTYQRNQIDQILSKWLSIAKKNIGNNMYVEVQQIWFKKGDIPEQLELMIAEQSNQSSQKQKKKSYVYKYSQQNFIIFKVGEENQKRCFKLPIKQHTFGKEIHFKIQAIFNNNKIIFKDDFIHKNVQSKSNGFTHELVLQKSNKDQDKRYQNCIIYFNIANSRNNNLNGINKLKIISIFKNVGQIQTKYKSSLHIQYSPHNFNLIRQLISHSTSQKLNKQSFQKTYYQLVQFIQKEENLSQTSIRQPKKDSNGFLMEKRFKKYQKKLQLQLQFQINNIKKDSKQSNLYSQQLKKQQFKVDTKQYKNLKEDLIRYNSKYNNYLNSYLIKFIYFISKTKQQQFQFKQSLQSQIHKTTQMTNLTLNLRYMSHLIPITEKFIILVFNQENNEPQNQRQSYVFRVENNVESFYTYMAFIAKHYPYSEINNLQNDLYILRWLVQKKLPFFNYYLNRNHIGLQNLIAPYLLTLFTSLSEQLTFRIWDYLILSNNKGKARIVIAYTLLTYFEATNMAPVIPINQFMNHVDKNMKVLSTDKQFSAKFAKIVNIYYKPQFNKQKKVQKIIKESPLNNIINDKYLNKIILGNHKPKIPLQQEGKISFCRKNITEQLHYQSVQQINYPLPRANYFGNPILEMIIFCHNLNVLDNLNLMAQKYFLKFQLYDTQKETTWSQEIQIIERNHYYNKSITIPTVAIHKDKNKKLYVYIVKEQDKIRVQQLSGAFSYESYNKDKAYRVGIVLKPADHHNKGESVLNISFCLKSNASSKQLQTKDYNSLQNICEKLLDYDVSENNETMTMLQRLKQELERIKFPLDEFEDHQNTKLQNSALFFYESQVLESSKVSIQQLKTIFYSLFSQQEEKLIRHQFSKYYQIFAEQNNFQFAYFAQMMIKFVLISDITKKKKLMYLFCLCVHYQNCYSKKINSQTLNFLIRIIYKQNMFINACPYSKNTVGKIIQACYFDADLKNNQNKQDFTDILKDWAYVSNLKLANFAIILGSYRDLSVLRSFFDMKTIKRIQLQLQCRFQIIYQIDGSKFIWSAIVESKTFKIKKRGSKFLNNYASYGDINYLNSTQEYLLNCENIIPLQNIKGYNYQQFTKELLSHSLISYLLELPFNFKRQIQKTEVTISSSEDAQKKDSQIQCQFSSWAIYRGQNCLQTWRRCKIIKANQVISTIQFEFDKKECSVETADIISMEEIEINKSKI